MIAGDLATILTLIVLEGLLSADNALVLALLVRHLPGAQRQRALRYGLLGAFAFRFLFLLAAQWLITLWHFKILGAAYLLYIGIVHLVRNDHADEARRAKRMGFWKTVVAVEITDVAFSIDSILAAVALSDKLWVVYLGGISGIVAMRFVAGGFLKLLDRYPSLHRGAYLFVVWIGLKLLINGIGHAVNSLGPKFQWSPDTINRWTLHLPEPLFWSGMAAILFGCAAWEWRHRQNLPHR